MIPSRGLRPVHRVQLTSCSAVRQFSSVQRNTALGARCSPRAHHLHAAPRRLHAPAVRHASWYAPWTWGRSSSTPAPSPDAAPAPAPAPEPVVPQLAQEPAVAAMAQESAPAAAAADAAPAAKASIEDLVDSIASDPSTLLQHTAEAGADAITRIGALKDLGLDYGWGTSALFEWMIEHIYLDGGLSWGVSIIVATTLIRCGLFGLQWKASDSAARIAAVGPVVRPLQDQMKQAKIEGNTTKQQLLGKQTWDTYNKVGANPLTSMLPMLGQMFMGFGAFRCLRGMSTLPAPGMTTDGFLWFSDLTTADPYFLLPMVSGGIMWLSLKLGGETGAANSTLTPGMKAVMTNGMPIFMTAVMAFQPAGLQLYVVSTTTLSAVTATILRNKSFRQATGIAPLPTPESMQLWTKVGEGKIPLDAVLDSNGQLKPITSDILAGPQPRYQAPGRRGSTTTIRLASSHAVPPHLNIPNPAEATIGASGLPDRDHDYDTPPTGFADKVEWFGRNYSPTFIWRRMKGYYWDVAQSEEVQKKLKQMETERAKEKKEQYEKLRRARFTKKY